MTVDVYYTDKRCQLFDRSMPDLPVFVKDGSRVLWAPSDWARKLALQGLSMGSVRTYATQLLDLLRQMDVDDISFARLSHAYLQTYRTSLEKRGVGPNYIAQLLGTHLRFIQWLEAENLVSGLIGCDSDFEIVLPKNKGERMPLIPKVCKKSPVAKMPSDRAIDATKAHLLRKHESLRERDELIIEWQRVVMLRAHEVSGLLIREIPSMDCIASLLRANRCLGITLFETKGGRPRMVDVHPALLQRTRDWIDFDRAEILSKARSQARKAVRQFAEPMEVFITRRGARIAPKTISNTIRLAWREAVKCGDVELGDRVWSHGLRHRAITNDLKKRLDAKQEGAVRLTMRQSGHRSEEGMEPYVHLHGSDFVEARSTTGGTGENGEP